MNKQWIGVVIPPFFKITIIKKQNIINYYMYNNFYFLKLLQNQTKNILFFDSETNTIVIKSFNFKNYNSLFKNKFKIFSTALNVYFYEKIKFTGKGFRIRYKKKKKLIKFFFGRSHLTWIFFRNIKLKRPHKYKFIISKSSKTKLLFLTKKIKNIKPINIYTKRGLRTKRQKIYKRKGKKNTTI